MLAQVGVPSAATADYQLSLIIGNVNNPKKRINARQLLLLDDGLTLRQQHIRFAMLALTVCTRTAVVPNVVERNLFGTALEEHSKNWILNQQNQYEKKQK